MNKFVSLLLSVTILLSAFSISSVQVHATETYTSDSGYNIVTTNSLPKISVNNLKQRKNAGTEVAKYLIKNLIKHGDDCAKVIARVCDDKAAKAFLKHHAGICAALTPFLEWADIPKNAVVDAVYRGVIASGGSEQVACVLKVAVKAAWEWFIF